MAAIVTTVATKSTISRNGQNTTLVREHGVSAANSADLFTTITAKTKRLIAVHVQYSAAPTYSTNIIGTMDSALGTAYDNAGIFTIQATDNSQYGTYLAADGYMFHADDQLVVNLPAGGGVITASIVVYWEVVG